MSDFMSDRGGLSLRMPVEELTFSAYARRRGCDEKAVRRAVENGQISMIERNGKKLVDPEVADLQWARNVRARVRPGTEAAPTAPTTPLPAGALAPASRGNVYDQYATGGSYQDVRTQREVVELDRARTEAARAAGRALDRERAERGAFNAFREVRDAVFAASKSAARRTIGMTEVRDIELANEDELRQAFAGAEERLRGQIDEAAKA